METEFYNNYKWEKCSVSAYINRVKRGMAKELAVLPYQKVSFLDNIKSQPDNWINRKCKRCLNIFDTKYFVKTLKICKICQKKQKQMREKNFDFVPEHKIKRTDFSWLNENQKAIVKKFILDTWNNYLIKKYYTYEDIYYYYFDNEKILNEVKEAFNLPDLKKIYLDNDE
jgi:hypothetical protein